MSTIPRNLNWVKALSECSVASVFSALHRGAEEDVADANEMRAAQFPGYPVQKFAVTANSAGNVFSVFEEGNAATAIRFHRESERVLIRASEREYAVTLTLNDAGECKLRIDGGGEQLEPWQVRRRVLEALLFAPTMPSTPRM